MANVVRYCGHCNSEIDAELRRLKCSNDSFQVKFQCLDCGASIGNALPHWQVRSLGDLPSWDMKLVEQRKQDRDQRLQIYKSESTLRSKQYQDYLNSAEWGAKRSLVFARANGVCEGCRKCYAQEVHHLTYKHIYREFLFELVALCFKCHERYHFPPPDTVINP